LGGEETLAIAISFALKISSICEKSGLDELLPRGEVGVLTGDIGSISSRDLDYLSTILMISS
jgi:hypothetical protein